MQFAMLFYLGKEIMPAVRILGLRVLWSGTVKHKDTTYQWRTNKTIYFLVKASHSGFIS